jgi:arginine-tRNA-protein transferase
MTTAHKLGFFATPPHDCNYLPDREAVTLFADPHFPKNTRIYSALADCGFRRSGEHLYIPHCTGCASCVPVRIPVNDFIRSRSQERTMKKNRHLSVYRLPAEFNEEHFQLYKRYIAERHPGGGMDDPDEKNYMDFLTSSWADTYFYEMRWGNKLIAIAVMDLMNNGISAVYTFFDLDYSKNSPGRFAILYEIDEAKRLGLQWLYLGYWIKGCGKMEYKNEYQPMEYFINNEWTRKISI